MQLAPGPLPPISVEWFDQSVSDPGFAALADEELAELPGLESGLDALFDPAALILDDFPDDDTGPMLDDAGVSLSALGEETKTWDVSAADAAKADGDLGFLATYAYTPGEAFQPVPPDGSWSGPPITLPPDTQAGFFVQNLSRPGRFDFVEGEHYEIDVQLYINPHDFNLYAGATITAYFARDGELLAPINLGKTDTSGALHYKGTWPQGSEGDYSISFTTTTTDGRILEGWTLTATVDAAGAGFTPNPAPLPPPITSPTPTPTPTPTPQQPGIVTVALSNLTRPGDTEYQIGDQWQLDVTGPPQQNIVIGGTLDDAALTPVVAGKTDAAGRWTLTGQFTRGDVGDWIETYSVGPVVWNGNLAFTVG